MKFIVDYSIDKDTNNYLNSVWKFTYLKHGRDNIQTKLLATLPEQFRKEIAKAKTKQDAKEIITDFLTTLPKSYLNTTPLLVLGIETLLNTHQDEIINVLESVYGKPFSFDKITVYLTTLTIQPYSFEDRWFMTYRNNTAEKHLSVAKHELNHFMFYHYYGENLQKRGLPKEKIEKLKESLVVLTNPEGNDKPDLKELESYIQTLRGQSMDQIIESCLVGNFFD
ncbi:MAG: hypothetical protein ACOX6N_03460 [Patescibacteria group bacterium]|jgi:hypothetical protein